MIDYTKYPIEDHEFMYDVPNCDPRMLYPLSAYYAFDWESGLAPPSSVLMKQREE